jgi:phosphopantothenoylcysteine synthetase/decarboxylase
MKVLLTSGGTKIMVDRVRAITNMSSGNFGAKIAHALLNNPDVELTYLVSEGGRTPFSMNVDFAEWSERGEITRNDMAIIRQFWDLYFWSQERRNRCEVETYKTFEDYEVKLLSSLEDPDPRILPDLVILAAAVSDYDVANVMDGKIRSGGNLNIQLEPTPKLIGEIKKVLPSCKLVGFKLLVDSTEEELLAAARKSIDENHCDLVVANDLRDIKAGKHRLLLVYPKHEHYKDYDGYESTDDPNYLARVVAEKSLALLE